MAPASPPTPKAYNLPYAMVRLQEDPFYVGHPNFLDHVTWRAAGKRQELVSRENVAQLGGGTGRIAPVVCSMMGKV